jgi:antitoxin component of MazEF toxin-antitoxin module
MTRTIQKIGNSRGIILNRTMLEHLGATDAVELTLEEGRIVLTAPRRRQTFEEATEATFTEYDQAMKALADASELRR